MIFDYYDAWVPQSEIGEVAQTTSTPGVGFPISGLITAARCDSYESRDWAFTIELQELDDLSPSGRHEYLKSYVDNEIPLVFLCKNNPTAAYHYKVLIGYDEGKDCYYFNDPWYTPWGLEPPDPCGPFSTVQAYAGEDQTRFERTWENAGYRIAAIKPIGVTLAFEGTPISASQQFELNCTIDPSMLTLPSDVRLELTLPSGFSVVNGEENVTIIDVNGGFTYQWLLESNSGISEYDYIEVLAKSIIGDTTYGGLGKIYPLAPPPPIISKPQIENASRIVPSMFEISSEIEYTGEFNVTIGVFNRTNTGNTVIYHDYVGDSIKNVETLAHAHRPEEKVFCWIEVNTIFGTYCSDILVVDIIDGDADQDGLSDYDEMVWHDSSPFLIDTDGDTISDYDEVNTYDTDPASNDSDSDTLSDYDELFVHNTDPCNNDTDSDLMPDDYEIKYGLNALVIDSSGDLDEDGLTNLQEYQYGTNPSSSDSDGDGMDDASEIEGGFDPLDASSNAMAQILPVAIVATTLVGIIIIICIVVKKRMK